MTSTDVRVDGIITADCSKCVCACMWALSNTFPQSLEHGTASD